LPDAGLVDVACDPLHQRARLSDQPLQRTMVVDNFKKLQRELVSLVRARPGDVAPFVETHQHAEHLVDGAAETAGDLTVGQGFLD